MFIYICQTLYLHLPHFQFMKKLNNRNSEKVYLVVGGCLLVICGRLLVICVHVVVVCGCLLDNFCRLWLFAGSLWSFAGGLWSSDSGLWSFAGGL